MKQEFYPTDMEDHVRIDKYLAEACPDLSRSYIQKLLNPLHNLFSSPHITGGAETDPNGRSWLTARA